MVFGARVLVLVCWHSSNIIKKTAIPSSEQSIVLVRIYGTHKCTVWKMQNFVMSEEMVYVLTTFLLKYTDTNPGRTEHTEGTD